MRWQKAGLLDDVCIASDRLRPHNTIVIPNCVFKLNISLQCTFFEVNCTKGRWLSAVAGAAGRGLTGARLETGIS